MNKVNNKQVIRRLALRELKTDRRMNFVVILSIMLTCILFTALTSIGGGLMNGIQQEALRQSGSSSMAGVKFVLPEDYEKIKSDIATRDVCYRILVGSAVNEEIKNCAVEVSCPSGKDMAKSFFSMPETGRLPETSDEVAVSTLVLDELGLPHEVGITVPLAIDIDGRIVRQDFTLCGFWEGNKLAAAQLVWVSKEFTDRNTTVPTVSFRGQQKSREFVEEQNGQIRYEGYWMVNFSFASSWNIEKKTSALLMRLYDDPDAVIYSVNWAYSTSSIDSDMLFGSLVMILLFFSAGYLIIYNIFHINVSSNIRSYGLLKTIGTTSKQIRKMVRVRAAVYCAVGIPFGLAAGVLLGKTLIGFITVTLNIGSAEHYTVSADILLPVCIIAAAFTFATVMISCRKPCKTAGSVSPIEALRYNETDINIKKDRKKSNKVTPLSIALNNMKRSRKKTAVIVLSLSLSLMILNTLFTVLNGMNAEEYVNELLTSDFLITRSFKDRNDVSSYYGITPEKLDYLKQTEGITDIAEIYYQQGMIEPSGSSYDKVKSLVEKYKDSDKYGDLSYYPNIDYRYSADIYGVSDTALDYLEPIYGSIDREKWQTGKYAIVYTEYIELLGKTENTEDDFYQPGDKVRFSFNDYVTEEQKNAEYEVMAICEMPHGLGTESYPIIYGTVIIPDSEYMKLCDNRSALTVSINADDEHYAQVSDRITYLTGQKDSGIIVKSKETYIKEYEEFVRMIRLVGGTLCVILALIGILNFVNTAVTGIISRKRELAMMNAVGMTGRQLKAMLCWEGIYYAVLTAAVSAAAESLLSFSVLRNMVGDMFFTSYHFTLLPILLCIPVLLLLSSAIPSAAYRALCRESVVERLREN